jgi:hypothetical protein
MKKKKPAKKTTKTKKTQKLPNDVSNEKFLEVLDNISKRLGHKFKFGYHDFEDMKQQAAIFALEGLERYDNTKPLENFLWTHVRNRLFNYKRNNYQRPDKPCQTCPFFDKAYKCSNNQCSEYANKLDCSLYASWASRNEAKKNIMQPSYIENDPLNKNTNFLLSIENNEIIKYLDDNIISEYRESYLRLRHGEKIPKQQLVRLQKYIETLMENFACQVQKDQKKEDS